MKRYAQRRPLRQDTRGRGPVPPPRPGRRRRGGAGDEGDVAGGAAGEVGGGPARVGARLRGPVRGEDPVAVGARPDLPRSRVGALCLALSLALSLSLTHTHTLSLSISLSLSPSLYLSAFLSLSLSPTYSLTHSFSVYIWMGDGWMDRQKVGCVDGWTREDKWTECSVDGEKDTDGRIDGHGVPDPPWTHTQQTQERGGGLGGEEREAREEREEGICPLGPPVFSPPPCSIFSAVGDRTRTLGSGGLGHWTRKSDSEI